MLSICVICLLIIGHFSICRTERYIFILSALSAVQDRKHTLNGAVEKYARVGKIAFFECLEIQALC